VRVLDGLIDRLLGDFVEDDALDRNFRLEHLQQVPADRFAFAIRVGREHDGRGRLHRGLQVLHVLPLVFGHDVVGREVAVGIDAEPAPLLLSNLVRHFASRVRQIAHHDRNLP
jgi:hypothetical protein